MVCALALPLVPVVTPVRTVLADQGLDVTSTTTYAIDPTAGVVHVAAEMTFTNTVPNKRDGNIIRQTYYKGFSVPAPVGSVGEAAFDSNGAPLTVTSELVDGNGNFFIYNVDFA